MEGRVRGEDQVETAGFAVFPTANLALRRAVDQLVEELSRVAPTGVADPAGDEPLSGTGEGLP